MAWTERRDGEDAPHPRTCRGSRTAAKASEWGEIGCGSKFARDWVDAKRGGRTRRVPKDAMVYGTMFYTRGRGTSEKFSAEIPEKEIWMMRWEEDGRSAAPANNLKDGG